MKDLDVRGALHKQIQRQHKDDADTLVLDELGVCQGAARVDVAVINGRMHGYEIKSAKDNLNRLPQQIEYYSSVFDRVTLVVSDNHMEEAISLIPGWWGVKKATMGPRGGIRLREIRRCKSNPSADPYSIAQLLWKDEALDALSRIGLAKGLKSKPRSAAWKALSESLPIDELRELTRVTLKARESWRSD